MPRKHKKVLRKNITLIMCALIGTIVVVYGVGMILFRGYVKEIANIAPAGHLISTGMNWIKK